MENNSQIDDLPIDDLQIDDFFIQDIQDKYSDFIFLEKQLEEYNSKLKKLKEEKELNLKVREILQVSAQITQNQFKKDLSDIVSLALKIVFGDRFGFKIRFVKRRNSTEADLLLVENGHEINPLEASGFGVCDVISVALRMSYLKLQQNARNCIIWDEPIRGLSKDKHILMAEMIKQISTSLGLQLIFVTHNKALIDIADKVILVKKEEEISNVEVLKP